MRNSVYLDYNATTKPRPSALEGAKKALEYWGNPSSVHQDASKAKNLLWSSRQNLSRFIGCEPLEIIWTSGASESNNQALKGLFTKPPQKRNELIISSIEHPSILSVADYLSHQGWKIHKIPVSKEGFLDESSFEKHLSEKTLLFLLCWLIMKQGLSFPSKNWLKKPMKKGLFFTVI